MAVIEDPQPAPGAAAPKPQPIPEKAQVEQDLLGLIPEIRRRGEVPRTKWLDFHAAWMGERTRFFFNGEVSQHYIPAARRHLESAVVRTRQLLTPFPDFFEVYPWEEQDTEKGRMAANAKGYVGFVLTVRSRLRTFIDHLCRCYYLYGRAVAKTGVRVTDTQYLVGQTTLPIRQVWPTVRAVDPFTFYLWPETVTHPEDATLIFEDVLMPWSTYQDHAALGVTEPIDRRDLGKPFWPVEVQIRLARAGMTEPDTVGAVGGVPTPSPDIPASRTTPVTEGLAAFVALTEAWYRTGGRWVQSWIVWNVAKGPRQVRFNPKPFPEPPYRMAVSRSIPGEHYTTSLMADLEPLNVWLNDQVNITQDAQWTAMSPPVLVNPVAVFDRNTLQFRPRAKWLVDPTGVQALSLPDTSRAGWAGIQAVMSFMEAFSGSNPLASGTPTRGMPRAGFAVSTLISLSMAELKAAAEQIEDDILTPLLADIYRLGVLYTPPQQRLDLPAVMGLPPRSITLGDMVGNWSFRWVGSVQAQDFQVRAQRLVSTLGVLAKVAPLAMQQGLKVDWAGIVKRIWRYGLGEMGAETLITQMSAEEMILSMLMQGGGALGGGPGPSPGAGASPTSSREQVERQAGRQASEGAVGAQMAGLGQG